jgi:hypothetical protein
MNYLAAAFLRRRFFGAAAGAAFFDAAFLRRFFGAAGAAAAFFLRRFGAAFLAAAFLRRFGAAFFAAAFLRRFGAAFFAAAFLRRFGAAFFAAAFLRRFFGAAAFTAAFLRRFGAAALAAAFLRFFGADFLAAAMCLSPNRKGSDPSPKPVSWISVTEYGKKCHYIVRKIAVRVANYFSKFSVLFREILMKKVESKLLFLEKNQERSRFFRISRSRTANSLVWTSYFHIFGRKIAKIATTRTHKSPPEVTEKDKVVAEATEAARS